MSEGCPFCRISLAFPFDESDVIPVAPRPDAVSPQCHLLLSTPQVVAFLDILPINPGHVLLTTREHFEKLDEVTLGPTHDHVGKPALRRPRNTFPLEGPSPAQALGFWMPLISRALTKTLNIEDWNMVQNNGQRAAQVVPHVHFHFIPRYADGRPEIAGRKHVDVGMLKSWKIFGKGSREEIDDDAAVIFSATIRQQLRHELRRATTGLAML